jgi:hypothetical protein
VAPTSFGKRPLGSSAMNVDIEVVQDVTDDAVEAFG